MPTQFLWFAPRLGVAWDVNGDGKMAIRAGIGRFYQRDRVSPGLGVGTSPAVLGERVRHPHARLRHVGDRRRRPGYGSRLQRARAGRGQLQLLAVERRDREGALPQHQWSKLAYVGSKGLDLFGQTNLNEVAPANRLAYAQTGNVGAPARSTGSPASATATWPCGSTTATRSTTRCRPRSSPGSATARVFTASVHLGEAHVEHRRRRNADGPGLSYNNAYTDSTQPNLDRARGANDRTHSFNASLVWALPTLEDKSGLVRTVLGDWEITSIVQAGTGYPITVIVSGSVPGLPATAMPRARA